ncbi:MAG: hypothetical protein IJ071_09900 [Ruminococcus sp.]|nr:hypothetical protein [Ruminococcus sp.]
MKKQDVIEVIALSLEQNEVTDDYTLKVVGLDANGNYTNAGQLFITETEMNELVDGHYIENPKQLIGRRLAVVSNAICKEVGVQHLNMTLTADEWQTLQSCIKKHNDPLADLGEDVKFEL